LAGVCPCGSHCRHLLIGSFSKLAGANTIEEVLEVTEEEKDSESRKDAEPAENGKKKPAQTQCSCGF
jgi:hypothetical protein